MFQPNAFLPCVKQTPSARFYMNEGPRLSAGGDRKRNAVRLSRSLEKNLLAYAAAATGSLAPFAQPANAEIIYTPSNIPITEAFVGSAITQFDINNDGVSDFAFINFAYFTHGLGASFLAVSPDVTGNEIVGVLVKGQKQVSAAAMSAGQTVGSTANLQSDELVLGGVFLGSVSETHQGGFLTVETAYLGLKFLVNGQVHYGWARIKFIAPGGYAGASIAGYAYESVPNQPIVVGRISGTAGKSQPSGQSASPTASAPTVKFQTLGALAAGSAGTQLWRGETAAE
jgi:hypothetical protein